jgi:AcrR family transcriptional regulator
MPTKSNNHAPAEPTPGRVRRGNVQDQEALRRAALDAAMHLFTTQGLSGVTMRAVAGRVGVSAMALYRYFPNKAGLLRGLWEFAITELNGLLNATLARPRRNARQKLRAFIDTFLRYYEERPDYFRLIFMTEQTYVAAIETRWADAPIYRTLLRAAEDLTRAVADEVGGKPEHVRLASDLRYALSTGYLHAKLINTRYPWQDLDALRAQAVEQIARAVENCLTGKG